MRAGSKDTPEKWRRQDIADLMREVVTLSRERIPYAELEARLTAKAQIDIDALREALRILKEVDRSRFQPPEGFERPETYIERLEALFANLDASHLLEEVEVGLRLQLAADPWFWSLLISLEEVDDVAGRLAELLTPKIALLTDNQVIELWANIVHESDPGRRYRLPRVPDIADEEFFTIASAADARNKIVKYVTAVRPKLERYAIKQGQTSFPIDSIGIARILSWTHAASEQLPRDHERQALRALSRIAVCCSKLFDADVEGLARAAQVSAEGYSLKGRAFAEEARQAPGLSGQHAEVALLHELEQLTRLSEDIGAGPSPLERILRAFKLGLEVAAKGVHLELRDKKELDLQRILCRFLVEREIRAFGTKFGWSEADLQAEDVFGALVIEAKVARAAPSTRTITSWLSQLKSYMDQAPLKHRGALVVFNFSAVAPPRFLHSRLLILPINLCTISPSGRTECIDIDEGRDGDALFRVQRISSTERAESKERPKTRWRGA
jgi:hypothetical protein